jgi:hypothetical protein
MTAARQAIRTGHAGRRRDFLITLPLTKKKDIPAVAMSQERTAAELEDPATCRPGG